MAKQEKEEKPLPTELKCEQYIQTKYEEDLAMNVDSLSSEFLNAFEGQLEGTLGSQNKGDYQMERSWLEGKF